MTRGNIKGADILRRRKKLGLTRTEYADRLAMPESTLKQYEKDKRSIPGVVGVAMRTVDYESKHR